MTDITSLKNHLLIAMPTMRDDHFRQAVTYVYEHNSEGAMGVIINKPRQITLGDLLHHLEIPIQPSEVIKHPVLFGGPVAEQQGFIIHLTADPTVLTLSASKEMLEEIAQGQGPRPLVVVLGYAGWTAGQLEQEIARNCWLTAPATPEIVFHTPYDKRWRAAAALIGVDLDRIASAPGHA